MISAVNLLGKLMMEKPNNDVCLLSTGRYPWACGRPRRQNKFYKGPRAASAEACRSASRSLFQLQNSGSEQCSACNDKIGVLNFHLTTVFLQTL